MQIEEELVQAVWEKARAMQDRDPTQWRQDQCGAWLHREQYNNADSDYGWKILRVVASGGASADDLQPFHHENDFDIANGQPQCRVAADRAGLAPGQRVGQPRNAPV